MRPKKIKSVRFCAVFIFWVWVFSFQSPLQSQSSEPTQMQFGHALKLLGEDQYAQARLELQNIIRKHPDFSKAYRKLVEAYLFLEDFDGAEKYFENMLV